MKGMPTLPAEHPLFVAPRAALSSPHSFVKSQRTRRYFCAIARSSAVKDTGSFENFVLKRQLELIEETEKLDGGASRFFKDKWQRDQKDANGGYGITAVLEGGDLLEKAAVNVSIVAGRLSPERAKAMSSRGRHIDAAGGQQYSATALSLVYHPAHPYVPTLRADVRQFKVEGSTWYGGGCDLTPAYLFEEDASEFHTFWKVLCDRHGSGLYDRFKQWADDYFYIPARKEHRGIGGIFFDDVTEDKMGEPLDALSFVEDTATGFLESWRPVAERRRGMTFGEQQRDWQLLRRGRYLEFNLLYDRGVKFGLGGRVESVMVSAPPLIAWKYNVVPQKGSPEEGLLEVLRTPKKWV